MTLPHRFRAATSFFDHLKLALEHLYDPLVLGEYSPLAAPYFLGQALQDMPTTAEGRGQALQDELHQALVSLWNGSFPATWDAMQAAVEEEETNNGRGSRYLCQVLELNYFHLLFLPRPQSQAEIYHDILHISRASHDRRLKEATHQLGQLLLQRIRPAVRQERPTLSVNLIGRDAILQEALSKLEQRHTVLLTGPGGVGKTALGGAIGEQWSSLAVFWYTIRPTFNDHLGNLLFALAHFLHGQGVSNLWHQLIADGGQVKDFQRALGLVRTDLEAMRTMPLLCLDEVDLLRPADPEDEAPAHTQLLSFIDSLRHQVPLLLMSQRAVIESDKIIALTGFVRTEMQLWLERFKIPYEKEDLSQLYDYTGGNPRLLELSITLYLIEDAAGTTTLANILNLLPQTSAVLPLWKRIQQRLDRSERQLLYALSVFRSPAPDDAWRVEMKGGKEENSVAADTSIDSCNDQLSVTSFDRLLQHRLVQRDGVGGVTLLPAIRKAVYNELTIEVREKWHLHAAQLRSQRGEYTAAAYHCAQGKRPDVAVEIWYDHRQEEILRGEAATALQLFSEISQNGLSKENARKLALVRGELYQLQGEPQQIVAGLEQVDWPTDIELTADADLLWGRSLVEQGKVDAGLEKFAHGLTVLARLQAKTSRLHFLRCQAQVQQRSMENAWQDAKRAQYNAELSQGFVMEHRGQYASAHQYYSQALATAQDAHFLSGAAACYSCLGNLANYQQNLSQALDYYQQALDTYDRLGNQFSRERVRSSVASAYVNSGYFHETIPPATQALRFFRAMNEPYWISLNAVNLAEAFAELGNLDEAETYAIQVLDQEEPHLHPYALSCIARVRSLQKRHRDSELYYIQAQEIAEMNEDLFVLAKIWRAMSEVQWEQERSEAAYTSAQQSLTLFHKLDLPNEISKTNELLQKYMTVCQEMPDDSLDSDRYMFQIA